MSEHYVAIWVDLRGWWSGAAGFAGGEKILRCGTCQQVGAIKICLGTPRNEEGVNWKVSGHWFVRLRAILTDISEASLL